MAAIRAERPGLFGRVRAALKWLMLACVVQAPAAMAADCVILLHGLARSDSSMELLEAALKLRGYHTVNYDYPSTEHPVAELADRAVGGALAGCPEQATIHFVTHSMGGILVRYYLGERSVVRLGRVVMLGPPNQGSQVVDALGPMPIFKWINGPAGLELGTDEQSVPRSLGPATFDLGIIAGTHSMNLILSTFLPDPNDGKVSVENTKLQGMSDHIALPVTHTFMMNDPQVIGQVLYFLEHGRFSREQE